MKVSGRNQNSGWVLRTRSQELKKLLEKTCPTPSNGNYFSKRADLILPLENN